ncbi:unnamed protein product [Mytilus coruscus]|uniref:Uncharacterized protein n=1 Tax=Mytilus coruscus TaxID=42192 RepID=A0A6J8DS62_MYTCO|nr:unnamed protein product [Mytilus coruscus]
MSEPNEDFSDHESGSKQGEPSAAVNQESSESRQDLVDTFDLFKTYFDHKLSDLKSEIISEQEHLSYKVKEDVNLKFRSEGNKIQYRFNEENKSSLGYLNYRNILVQLEKRNRPAPYARTPSNIRSETAPIILTALIVAVLLHSSPFVRALHGVSRAHWIYAYCARKLVTGKNTVLSTLGATRTKPIQATKSSKAP